MGLKKCISCLRDKPVGEFSVPNGISRECASCHAAFISRLTAAPLPAPVRRRNEDARERRAAREASAPGTCTEAQRGARWAYYGGRCWMCRGAAAYMDHVKPLHKGGSNWPANLRPACWACNTRKAARWPFAAQVNSEET